MLQVKDPMVVEAIFVNRRHIWMLGSLEVFGTKLKVNYFERRFWLKSGDNPKNRDNQQLTWLRLGGSTLGKIWVRKCLRYGLLPLETVFTSSGASLFKA
jgi:hypothetical protein